MENFDEKYSLAVTTDECTAAENQSHQNTQYMQNPDQQQAADIRQAETASKVSHKNFYSVSRLSAIPAADCVPKPSASFHEVETSTLQESNVYNDNSPAIVNSVVELSKNDNLNQPSVNKAMQSNNSNDKYGKPELENVLSPDTGSEVVQKLVVTGNHPKENPTVPVNCSPGIVGEKSNIESCTITDTVKSPDVKESSDEFFIKANSDLQSDAADIENKPPDSPMSDTTIPVDCDDKNNQDLYNSETDNEEYLKPEQPTNCFCHTKKFKKYRCGYCTSKFTTICLLHEHLRKHGSSGSYHYDQVSYTAYPKYDSYCSAIQTDVTMFYKGSILGSILEAEKDRIENKKLKFKRNRKQSKPKRAIPVPSKQPKVVELEKENSVQADDQSVTKESKKRGRKPGNKGADIGLKSKVRKKIKLEQKDDFPATEYHEVKENIKMEAAKDDTEKIEDKNAAESFEINNTKITIKPLSRFDHAYSRHNLKGVPGETEAANETDSIDFRPKDAKLKHSPKKRKQKAENSGDIKEKKEKKERKVPIKEERKEPQEKRIIPRQTKVIKKKTKKEDDLYMACEICKTIVLQKKYKEHMVMHTGEKTFICEVCGMAYAKLSNLTRHKITHREIKPYRCEFCPAQFVRKKDYDGHVNSHKGYRPHVHFLL